MRDRALNFDLLNGIFGSIAEWLETSGYPFTPEQSEAVRSMLAQGDAAPTYAGESR